VFYNLLSDLRKQMMLAALAGLYHQWGKDLREFIGHELVHDPGREVAAKLAWTSGIATVLQMLEKFGWACRAQQFFAPIDACRLVVNVYKHGKGQSLDELITRYPRYLKQPFRS